MSCREAFAIAMSLAVMVSAVPWDVDAATLVTTSKGEEYRGEVVSAGVNTLTVKLGDTGYKILPLNVIDRVKVDIDDGTPIEGKLLDWSDGELTVRVGDRDVSVREGTIVSVREVTIPAGGPEEPAVAEPAPAEPAIAEPAPVTTAPTSVIPAEPEVIDNESENQSEPITNATM
jgi:hypothetical protein